MAEKNIHIDYELITKYLAGEAATAENQKVEEWLNSSIQNRDAFAQMKKLWQQTGKIVPSEETEVDVDDAWSHFKDKINSYPAEVKPETKTRSLFFYVSRIAAVLVVGFLFYFVIENLSLNQNQANYLSTDQNTLTDTLTDGTVVSLNVRSQISYSVDFQESKRAISLQGEAFFDVQPDTTKPFTIRTDGVAVTVLGTEFYVSAYDSINTIKVGVQEGRVEVRYENSKLILNKGESLTIDKSTNDISSNPYEPNELYWKSQTLIFQDDQLAEVFQTLEEIYAMRIEVKNEDILNCRLTAKFYQEDIERIFEIIGDNFQLTTQNENNHFIVSGAGCK